MLFQKKGRKIYTYRVKNRRVFSRYSPLRSAAVTVLSLVVLCVLGVIGYSVIGPLVIRMEQEKQSPTTVPDPFTAETVTTAATTEATLTTADDFVETTTTTTTVEPYVPQQMNVRYLKDEAMHDADALSDALQKAAADGFHAVVMPLKQYGGFLYYASALEGTNTCGAVQSEWTAKELADMAKAAGLIPMAEIVTIADYCYPTYSFESGYFFEDSDERWLDDKAEEGGKPWMSPFAEASRSYLCAVARELSEAGFVKILCADTQYPDFYASDLKYIGKDVSDKTRRADGLAQVLNALNDADVGCVYAFDLYRALNKEEEAIRSELLSAKEAVITFDYYLFSTPFYLGNDKYDPKGMTIEEHTELLLMVADAMAGEMAYTPCISRHGLTDEEMQQAVLSFRSAGFDTVFFTE